MRYEERITELHGVIFEINKQYDRLHGDTIRLPITSSFMFAIQLKSCFICVKQLLVHITSVCISPKDTRSNMFHTIFVTILKTDGNVRIITAFYS